MVETEPLTPLMRQLLTAMPRDAARRMMRNSALVLAIIVPLVLIAQAVQRQFRLVVAIEFVGVCALIVLVLSWGTKIQIEPFPLREHPTLHGLGHGTALYAQSGDLLFALWDAQGRCLHRYPGFDSEVDAVTDKTTTALMRK